MISSGILRVPEKFCHYRDNGLARILSVFKLKFYTVAYAHEFANGLAGGWGQNVSEPENALLSRFKRLNKFNNGNILY